MRIYNKEGIKILDVIVDDNSCRNKTIMGDDILTLHYSLPQHIEIPVGSYCIFNDERYTLMRPESLKMEHSRNFEYTLILESVGAKSKIWKFRNTVDGRLKFSLTAKPHEHLQMFIDNMNRHDSGWEIGDCMREDEIVVNYDHVFCWDALAQMAAELKSEFEFNGKTVSLHKVEYNRNNPLKLAYGKGNGLKRNVGRINYGDKAPVEILFVQGGEDNIDRSRYGNSELLLPKLQQLSYDGKYFAGELGFNSFNSRSYITDNLGLSIRRSDKSLMTCVEDSLDCSDIYPKRIGRISNVIIVDEEQHFYDIVDNEIPSTLNYGDYLIAGETMTVRFQTGMLAGKDFEVKYIHEQNTAGQEARRFEIVPQEIDGQTMPNDIFSPKIGDTYAVFGCMLPDDYICNNRIQEGASWDMFRAGVKYLYENEDEKFVFSGEIDSIWAKKHWENIRDKIKLGGYVEFSDERFQKEKALVRITGIKDFVNNPYSPELTLSNSLVQSGFLATLRDLQSKEVLIETNYRKVISFTKRRFRANKSTVSIIEKTLDSNSLNLVKDLNDWRK